MGSASICRNTSRLYSITIFYLTVKVSFYSKTDTGLTSWCARWKVKESPKWLQLILRWTQLSVANFIAIYSIVGHITRKLNFDLIAQEKMSGDHQSHKGISSGDHGVAWVKWWINSQYFILDQSGGPAEWQTDIPIPPAMPLAWQKKVSKPHQRAKHGWKLHRSKDCGVDSH